MPAINRDLPLKDLALPARSAGAGNVPVRDLEVVELRAFCAAASLGSIAEAARAMNISQPAMSKRLRALETVVGGALLERSSRGVTLTPAGLELYSAARRLLRNADSMQALIATSTPAAPVRIASSPTIADLRLPEVLAQISAREPRLTAELISANTSLVRELVHHGRVDLGIAGLDPYALHTDALEERTVWRDELVIVVPPGHPWEDLEEIPAAEFAATSLLQRDPWSNASRVVTSSLDRIGLERTQPQAVIGSNATVIAAARASGTPALISALSARTHPELQLEVRRVEGLRLGLEYGLVWLGSMHDLRPEVQVVANHILQLPFARSRTI